jgi:dTDP-4-dehydrorhamnose reductase
MRILILGITGMLGKDIFSQLSKTNDEVYGTGRVFNEKVSKYYQIDKKRTIEGVDVKKIDELVKVIELIKPDIVINCIGLIKQIKKNINEYLELNSVFPRKLLILANRYNFKIIHFSTDCVFSGKDGKYKENDIPDPIDDYGLSKYLGEIYDKNCLTIRTSIIGKEINSNYGLLEWFLINSNKYVDGYKNAIWSGLTTLEVANQMKKIIDKFFTSDLHGIKHLSSNPINKFDLLTIIKNVFEKEIEIYQNFDIAIDRSLIPSSDLLNITGKIKSHEDMIKDLFRTYYTKIEEKN